MRWEGGNLKELEHVPRDDEFHLCPLLLALAGKLAKESSEGIVAMKVLEEVALLESSCAQMQVTYDALCLPLHGFLPCWRPWGRAIIPRCHTGWQRPFKIDLKASPSRRHGPGRWRALHFHPCAVPPSATSSPRAFASSSPSAASCVLYWRPGRIPVACREMANANECHALSARSRVPVCLV